MPQSRDRVLDSSVLNWVKFVSNCHSFLLLISFSLSLPGGSVVKKPPANTRDSGLIPGLGISVREGNGKSLQYSCLGNPMGRGAWQTAVHGVAKESDMT